MQDEASPTTSGSQAPRDPDPAGTDGASELNPALLLLFVAIVVLVSLQNLWLRRRARNQGRAERDPD